MSAASPSTSETIDTGSGSGIAGVGAQARQTTAGAETTADIGQSEAYTLNLKRMVEEFMGDSLAQTREQRGLFNRLAQNAVTHDQQLQTVALQALQNAVVTSDMVAKQTTRHHDIAIDRQWNLDEVATRSVLDTAAIADMLKKSFGTTDLAEILSRVKASA